MFHFFFASCKFLSGERICDAAGLLPLGQFTPSSQWTSVTHSPLPPASLLSDLLPPRWRYPSIAFQSPPYGPEGGRQDGKHCPQLACEETKKSTGFLCCSHMTSLKPGPVGHHQATYPPRRSVLYNKLDAEMLTKTSRSKHEEQSH